MLQLSSTAYDFCLRVPYYAMKYLKRKDCNEKTAGRLSSQNTLHIHPCFVYHEP